MRIFSFISFFSFFVSPLDRAGTVAHHHASDGQLWSCFGLPYPGAISKSQPTGCGHTLPRCPLPGWRVAAAPSTPAKAKRPKP